MKCYTIIDSFESLGSADLWVANYANEEDAIKCLKSNLEHWGLLDDDGVVVDDSGSITVAGLFNTLLTNGNCYHYDVGSDSGNIFVRGEEIQDKFDPNQMPFG